MAPKSPEKLHQQQQQQLHKLQVHNNTAVVKHSNHFYISAHSLCHNKRLKFKRSKYVEYLRKYWLEWELLERSSPSSTSKLLKTEAARRQQLSLLQADVTIDLLSDDDDGDAAVAAAEEDKSSTNQSVIVYPERMCLERAAILGLMPVERNQTTKTSTQPAPTPTPSPSPPLLVPMYTNHNMHLEEEQQISITQQMPMPPMPQPAPPPPAPPTRKRKSKPQKRRSLPAATGIVSRPRLSLPHPPSFTQAPIILNYESIVLSDDDDDECHSEIVITCPTSQNIPCLPTHQNTMQVDEEVTISLVPRSLTAAAAATACSSASRSTSSSSPLSSLSAATTINTKAAITAGGPKPNSTAFPMLPDETTVHTVIANRIYELSLTKLREGLASCGIPEFADSQKISPQRRKGTIQQPPLVNPPQAPISLKLSSDLSISLISDDEDDAARRQRFRKHEDILSPDFLQKLPVNVSIAPVPMMMMRPQTNSTEPRKLKLG